MTEPEDATGGAGVAQVSPTEQKAAETESYIGTPISDDEMAQVWTDGTGTPDDATGQGADAGAPPDGDVSDSEHSVDSGVAATAGQEPPD